jgi:hypothetical protein
MDKKHPCKRRRAMPVFRRYEWGNYAVSIYPVDRIRRFVRFFPYLYGSNISFLMKINRQAKVQGISKTKYEWQLWWWDVNSKSPAGNGAGEFQIPPKGKIKKKLDAGYFSVPGQYILEMRILETIDGKENFGDFEEVATFTIMDRDLFSAQWFVGIVGGLIGAGVALLVRLLLR